VAEEGLAHRGLVADATLGRRGLGGADDHVLDLLAVHVQLHLAADLDLLVVAVRVDDDGVLHHLLEREDAALEEGLVVLRLLQLGVLGEIAELHGGVDPVRDLLALHRAKLLELGLELLQAIGRDRDRLVSVH
jgi:hypothetical protein